MASLASSSVFHRGLRRFGSRLISSPRARARLTAWRVAEAAGSSVRERVPKWNTFAPSNRDSGTSSGFMQVSAPGLRAKLKSRLPEASRETKARVVNTVGSMTTPAVSMPAFFSVPVSSFPKASSPTLPIMAVRHPYRQRRQEVAGSAAGIGGQHRISRLADGLGGKVDQQFTQRNDIIHGFFLLYSFGWFRRRRS